MSSDQSYKYHSITIGTKNTWDDWHLIPSSRPLFNPPPVKTSYVEIPGGDGVLDLTTSLTGKPLYSNRTGSWEFFVENGFKDWSVLYSEIMLYLHGQEYKAWLDDDMAYYYEGRFSVNQWKSNPAMSSIVIDYNVGPYKQYAPNDANWLWDPFNFETGVIRYYKNLPVKGMLKVDVVGDAMDTVPTITSSVAGIRLEFNGASYILKKGANIIDDIIITDGDNPFFFYGNGKISIDIVGGRL